MSFSYKNLSGLAKKLKNLASTLKISAKIFRKIGLTKRKYKTAPKSAQTKINIRVSPRPTDILSKAHRQKANIHTTRSHITVRGGDFILKRKAFKKS